MSDPGRSQSESEFQDNINVKWDATLIADTVYEYVMDYNISIVRALPRTCYR